MPLPQQVTEQLSRVPARTPGASRQLLMLTSLLFFLSLASYLGLEFGYKPYLDSQITGLDKEIENFGKQVPPQEQTKIINFYSQLANLESLLTHHTLTTLFFEWFEKNTQVNLYYENFRYDVSKGEVTLSGQAKTIEDISEQLLILDQLPEVKKANLGNMRALPGGLWQFALRLSLDPKIVNPPSSGEENSKTPTPP